MGLIISLWILSDGRIILVLAVERAKKTGIVEDYDEFYRYAGLDVGGTFQLFQKQYPRAEQDDVLRPYHHLLIRGNEFCTESN